MTARQHVLIGRGLTDHEIHILQQQQNGSEVQQKRCYVSLSVVLGNLLCFLLSSQTSVYGASCHSRRRSAARW